MRFKISLSLPEESEDVGQGEGNLGGETERVVIAIEGSDDIGVADGDGGERLGAVDENGLALGVATCFGVAAAFGGRDGQSGASGIGEHVAE